MRPRSSKDAHVVPLELYRTQIRDSMLSDWRKIEHADAGFRGGAGGIDIYPTPVMETSEFKGGKFGILGSCPLPSAPQ